MLPRVINLSFYLCFTWKSLVIIIKQEISSLLRERSNWLIYTFLRNLSNYKVANIRFSRKTDSFTFSSKKHVEKADWTAEESTYKKRTGSTVILWWLYHFTEVPMALVSTSGSLCSKVLLVSKKHHCWSGSNTFWRSCSLSPFFPGTQVLSVGSPSSSFWLILLSHFSVVCVSHYVHGLVLRWPLHLH